jgi:hypothetical protein
MTDVRAERIDAIAEIVFGSVGLALFLNAVLALVLAPGSRAAEGHANNLLVASVLALMPLQSLNGRGVSRAQANSLILLSVAMAVAVRFFIYT